MKYIICAESESGINNENQYVARLAQKYMLLLASNTYIVASPVDDGGGLCGVASVKGS